jgi:hypothetical protein
MSACGIVSCVTAPEPGRHAALTDSGCQGATPVVAGHAQGVLAGSEPGRATDVLAGCMYRLGFRALNNCSEHSWDAYGSPVGYSPKDRVVDGDDTAFIRALRNHSWNAPWPRHVSPGRPPAARSPVGRARASGSVARCSSRTPAGPSTPSGRRSGGPRPRWVQVPELEGRRSHGGSNRSRGSRARLTPSTRLVRSLGSGPAGQSTYKIHDGGLTPMPPLSSATPRGPCPTLLPHRALLRDG